MRNGVSEKMQAINDAGTLSLRARLHIIISSYHHIIISPYHHIMISSYYQIIMSSYHHSRRKTVSQFWAKSQRKNRKSFLTPFTKQRRDLKFGGNGVIFRGESASNAQKFVARPKRAIFDLMLTFCSENFMKKNLGASKNEMWGIV